MRKSETEYLFRVNLKGRKRIWRTIALRGDQTLNDLHEGIFGAFDRFEPHLYSFYFPKAPSRRRVSGPQPREYTVSGMLEQPGLPWDADQFDAAKARLDDLRLKPGQRFEYLFDFGDSLWHEVMVEAIKPAVALAPYPRMVEKRGKSPAQY